MEHTSGMSDQGPAEEAGAAELTAESSVGESPATAATASSARPRVLRIVAIVFGIIVLLGMWDVVTASPILCASCHEMQPRHATWERSAHAAVSCVRCHTAPHRWYEVPQSVVSQTALLARDVVAHVRGGYPDPVDGRLPGTEPMADEICLQCHDVNRKATSGFRILIDHAEHAKRNKSCVSCHVRTAHPLPDRGTPLSLMSQCFTCHGTTKYPTASAQCSVCHPVGYALKPTSHKTAKWNRGHAVVAKADPKQCVMCHTKAFCTDCHGLEMPHPEGWGQGKTGHGINAEANRAMCARCHKQKPDLCSMCHHVSYDPTKGTWAKQHFLEVEARGAAGCFECHQPAFCVRCHVRQPEDD